MNEAALVEVFGSQSRLRALRALFGEPGRGFGTRELAAVAGLDPGGVARMLKRWTAAGLVTRRQQDGLPRYYASSDPAFVPLVDLMRQDSDLVRLLREALARAPGVEVAVVFGSVARGTGGAQSDVDLLVLGTPSELKVNAALKPAGRSLGRPVHATVNTVESFRKQLRNGEGFALDIVQNPRIALMGDLHAALAGAPGG